MKIIGDQKYKQDDSKYTKVIFKSNLMKYSTIV